MAEINFTPDQLEQMQQAAAQRDVLARLLARCLDPLRNLEAEGDAEDGGATLRDLIRDADAALQALAQQELEEATGRRQVEMDGLAA